MWKGSSSPLIRERSCTVPEVQVIASSFNTFLIVDPALCAASHSESLHSDAGPDKAVSFIVAPSSSFALESVFLAKSFLLKTMSVILISSNAVMALEFPSIATELDVVLPGTTLPSLTSNSVAEISRYPAGAPFSSSTYVPLGRLTLSGDEPEVHVMDLLFAVIEGPLT